MLLLKQKQSVYPQSQYHGKVLNNVGWILHAMGENSCVWERKKKNRGEGWRPWTVCALGLVRPDPAEEIGFCYLETVKNIPREGQRQNPN